MFVYYYHYLLYEWAVFAGRFLQYFYSLQRRPSSPSLLKIRFRNFWLNFAITFFVMIEAWIKIFYHSVGHISYFWTFHFCSVQIFSFPQPSVFSFFLYSLYSCSPMQGIILVMYEFLFPVACRYLCLIKCSAKIIGYSNEIEIAMLFLFRLLWKKGGHWEFVRLNWLAKLSIFFFFSFSFSLFGGGGNACCHVRNASKKRNLWLSKFSCK